ncbi:MAG: alpha-L-rhamnosidase [Puniceicoccaceae bacterium]|nr:MAG: alpha-L-rhamnosidase [Puniceicoccaceae bacterium]
MPSSLLPPTDLRCETAVNPLGIGETRPLLRWKLQSRQRDQAQSAWQVIVSTDPAALKRGEGDLWDSGKVGDAASNGITYAGRELHSRQRCWWKARVWDARGRPSGWSEAAWWELGLLTAGDWSADWIESAVVGGKWTSAPAPYFRKGFTLPAAVAEARLYITALGVFDASINGSRISDEVFSPGWTNYLKHVQVSTYDVTRLLKKGDNRLGVILGDGWYCGFVSNEGRQIYGDRPRLLAQLEVRLKNGETIFVGTDPSWETRTGPILEADFLMGESQDARLALPDWDRAGGSSDGWVPALPAGAVTATLIPRIGPAVRPQEVLRPVGPAKAFGGWNHRSFVYDLGQNITGSIRLTMKHRAGKTIRLRFAERLQDNGRPYYENLRSARATDSYTFATDGEETFEPRFTFHGFQYIELIVEDSREDPPPPEAIEAIVLHSDIPPTGSFQCSHPLLNRLYQNIEWGQRGNYLDVPTDCPQRDERLGWTGDAQMFIATGAFIRDIEGFFTRWQLNLDDAQQDSGAIPAVIPHTKPGETKGNDSGPAWSDAVVICPWTIYRHYGNTRILERHFDSLRRYVDFLESSSKNLIRCHPDTTPWGGFGDWLTLDAETPTDLIGTAFFAYSAGLLGRIADTLGKSGLARRYGKLSADVAAAFRHRFVTPEGLVVANTQTAYVLALKFDLLTPEMRPVATEALVRHIRKRGWHLATGFVGTPYLNDVLSENGHLDVAYRLLEQESYPSWLFPVTQGATTIWERWDGWTIEKGFQTPSMNSFNHYAYGAIGEWIHTTVAGINLDPEVPGYRRIHFRPRPGGSLTWAEGSLESPCGRIALRWEKTGNSLNLALEIPVNTRAVLHLPAPYTASASAGNKRLRISRKQATPQIEFGSGNYRLVLRAK